MSKTRSSSSTPSGGVNAHILLESSQELAQLVWGMKESEMAFLAPNAHSSALWRQYEEKENSPIKGMIGFTGILNKFLYGIPDFDDTERLGDFLRDVSKQFKLEDKPLVLVHAGTHSTLTPSSDAYANAGVGPVDNEGYMRLAGERYNRAFSGLVYAFLSGVDGLEVEWLANVFTDLRPKLKTGDDLDKRLARRARKRLETEKFVPRSVSHLCEIAAPSVPMLFLEDDDEHNVDHENEDGYRLYDGGSERPVAGMPFTTTDRILHDFAAKQQKQPTLNKKVLVKVAAEELDKANPLDPPVLRDRHILKAAECGITKILLDARVGVIDTTQTEEWPQGLSKPIILAV